MNRGRKNLKRAVGKEALTPQEGQTIMQVVSLRGSNLIEVMDAQGKKSLAIFPAKFSKSMWMRRGSFVMVDESGRDKALESGSKVACMVTQVLFYEQVRALQRTTEWPEVFKTATTDESKIEPQISLSETAEGTDSSDDDGYPPLEANLNRIRPIECQSDPETDTDTDSESSCSMVKTVSNAIP